ncbi:MAG: zinc ABC transporter solute-binding protein [Thermodesulfobacteria bacterium]|nr:zinc ABC transporter solute-binding protein [Thermodesulfobacteriota bacterium]
MKRTVIFFLILSMALVGVSWAQDKEKEKDCHLRIGVTLHPYYSWVKNIVGDKAEVIPVIPPNTDPHSYQPTPKDMEVLNKIDVLVINNLGHDEFIKPMLKAIGRKDLVIIDTSKGLPLIPVQRHVYAFEKDSANKPVAYNSHTYISITGSIQQIQHIARELGKLCPQYAKYFRRNSRAYAKRLRKMLANALQQLEDIDTTNLRIATVHDGYAYLFQELGIEVAAVVQPRHGIEPTARQLQDTIRRIKRARVNILFTELDYKKKYVDIIYKETGCRIYSLSHISHGKYTADFFEKSMQKNLDTIVKALRETANSTKKDVTKL